MNEFENFKNRARLEFFINTDGVKRSLLELIEGTASRKIKLESLRIECRTKKGERRDLVLTLRDPRMEHIILFFSEKNPGWIVAAFNSFDVFDEIHGYNQKYLRKYFIEEKEEELLPYQVEFPLSGVEDSPNDRHLDWLEIKQVPIPEIKRPAF